MKKKKIKEEIVEVVTSEEKTKEVETEENEYGSLVGDEDDQESN